MSEEKKTAGKPRETRRREVPKKRAIPRGTGRGEVAKTKTEEDNY